MKARKNNSLKKGISNKKCESKLLILEVNRMRKVFCVLLGFLLVVSGCGEHITAHCLDLSDEIATAPDMRKNYHPTITPITDVVADCYCHVEDAAIVTVAAPVVIAFWGIFVVGSLGGVEALGELLEASVN